MTPANSDRSADLADLRRTWDSLASEDPMHYIESSRRDWDERAFFASGEHAVAAALEWLGPDATRDRALEIGCGLGRTAIAFARTYGRVDGVDVSRTMIERARAGDLPANVHLVANGGADLDAFPDGAFDLVYSQHVFQHVPPAAAIAAYLGEIARVLAPGGDALLQFDTRRESTLARLIYTLPDPMLPRLRRRHIRRYRRDPAWLAETIVAAGLVVAEQRAPGSEHHWLRLRRARR